VKWPEIEISGATALPHPVNGYLFFPDVKKGHLSIYFPLAQQDIVLTNRARRIRTRLEGDRVQAMENFGADLTFFAPLP